MYNRKNYKIIPAILCSAAFVASIDIALPWLPTIQGGLELIRALVWSVLELYYIHRELLGKGLRST